MILEKVNNKERVLEIMYALLHNTCYQGFTYCDTFFALQFGREAKGEFEGSKVPWFIEIKIMTDFWFDSHEDWKKQVKRLRNDKIVEPIEPVLAYELTCLRWMNESKIDQIQLDENSLRLIFKNRKILTVSLKVDMDYSWVIKESNVSDYKSTWSLVCEDGEFYLKTP